MSSQKRADLDLGKRIRKMREAASISQRELAAELKKVGFGIDPSAVTRIESGERPLKLAEAKAVAGILQTTVGELLNENEKPVLNVVRARADAHMHTARANLRGMLTEMAVIQVGLREDPRLMALFSNEASQPDGPDDYLNWVRGRVQLLAKNWPKAAAQNAADADALRKIAASLMAHVVEVDPEFFDWSSYGGDGSDG